MTVKDAISSYSPGELAPVPNPFVQPGTYESSTDAAMTDGVRHAMLKAQMQARSALKKPGHVKRHLQTHHAIADSDDPVAEHERQHTGAIMNQGHSVASDGALAHSNTDMSDGAANFVRYVAEAPPLVELTRHVRSARGAAFYHKSIGTPLTGDNPEQQYLDQKAANDKAKQVRNALKAEQSATTSHPDLLAARRDARAKFPAGHPERLAAERAVRASRRAGNHDSGRSQQAHVSPKKKLVEAKKDPAFYAPREHLITGGAATSSTTVGVGGSFAKNAPVPANVQVADRLHQLATMSPGEKSQYFALRNAGVMHDRAMAQIQARRARPVVPTKVVAAAKQRRTRTRG